MKDIKELNKNKQAPKPSIKYPSTSLPPYSTNINKEPISTREQQPQTKKDKKKPQYEPPNPMINPPEYDVLSTKDKTKLTKEQEEKLSAEILRNTYASIAIEKEKLRQERNEYMRSIGLRGLKSYKRNIHKRRWRDSFVYIAKAFAALGLNDADIAYLFEVDPKTLQSWKRRHPELTARIKEGRAMRNTGLLMDLTKSSHDGSFAVQIFLAKNWLGMTDRIDATQRGELNITYKSHIPREKGVDNIDPGTIKEKRSNVKGTFRINK